MTMQVPPFRARNQLLPVFLCLTAAADVALSEDDPHIRQLPTPKAGVLKPWQSTYSYPFIVKAVMVRRESGLFMKKDQKGEQRVAHGLGILGDGE
jgi:hypothetical protein